MKGLILATLVAVGISGVANAQCAGGLVPNCPPAASPQQTDVVLLWQYGQNPHQRRVAISQILASGFLSATTGSIGGGALSPGGCASGAVTVAGVTNAMGLIATPVGNPQVDASHGLAISAYVSSTNTVTVNVCAIAATTPVARAYNVRAIP